MNKNRQSFPWEQPAPSESLGSLLDLTFDRLLQQMVDHGFKAIHATRLFEGIHRHGFTKTEQFPEGFLPAKLFVWLGENYPAIDPIVAADPFPSGDGATKYNFRLKTGDQVEGVFMPFAGRSTMCISSQVGCAMGCTFCATGTMGFRRHLSPGEMVSQVLHMKRNHFGTHPGAQRFNIVFMGMGEPLHNLENVMAAFNILTHRFGLVLAPRDIAVSTSGLVKGIRALAGFRERPQLMVSIAATDDRERSALMPVNRAYPLASLLTCLESYPLRKRERIMLSYVLIAGENDSDRHAEALAAMAARFPSLVNLIPMNPHEGSPGMKEPAETRLNGFYKTLVNRGIFTTIRRSRGRDVAGACGQLVNLVSGPKPKPKPRLQTIAAD